MLGEQLRPISFGGSSSERIIVKSFGASIAILQVAVVSPGCIASQMSPEFVRIRMPPGLCKCCDKISIVLILLIELLHKTLVTTITKQCLANVHRVNPWLPLFIIVLAVNVKTFSIKRA